VFFFFKITQILFLFLFFFLAQISSPLFSLTQEIKKRTENKKIFQVWTA